MTEFDKQYFGIIEQKEISKHFDITDLKLISTDTYSDNEIWKSIQATGRAELLLCAAIQMCIVGFGNKTYGSFKFHGEEYDIATLFKESDVKCDLSLASKIGPNELTPRRIQRFFRFQVYRFLEVNKSVLPYLWRKYSNRDVRFRSTTFPGAESLLTEKEEIDYLLSTYQFLDERNNTKIHERICRVLEARGLKLL